MYSVLRITAEPKHLESIWALGDAMNRWCPRYSWVQRQSGDGIACDVSCSQDWAEHISALLDLFHEQRSFLTEAINLGSSATVDIAVEPEDQRCDRIPLVLPLEPAILAAFASLSVRLEVSVY